MALYDFLRILPFKNRCAIMQATSLYKIGHSIKERHYIKKLAEFIQALNKGLAGDAQVKVFRDRILHDQKKLIQQKIHKLTQQNIDLLPKYIKSLE